MEKTYEVQRDDDEPYLFVREWEDDRLFEEFEFLAELFANITDEVAFRVTDSQYGGELEKHRGKDTELYTLIDQIEDIREGLPNND